MSSSDRDGSMPFGSRGLVIMASFSDALSLGALLAISNAQRILAGFAAGHADMDFVSLTEGQGCRGDRGFERGFLGDVSAFDVAIMQHAPFTLDRHDRVLSKAHRPTPSVA